MSLTYIKDEVYQKKHGWHDYAWWVEVTVPAKTKITICMYPSLHEVWREKGYEFEPDALDVFKITHRHDGRLQFKDLLITESLLSWRYTQPEYVENIAEIEIENIDDADHTIRVIGLYRAIPRDFYQKIWEEV